VPVPVVPTVSAVDAGSAAEFGDDHYRRLAPGVAHVGLDPRPGPIERTKQG